MKEAYGNIESPYKSTAASACNHSFGDKDIKRMNPERNEAGEKSPVTVQCKLNVSAANDPYEKEADAVSGKVMRLQGENFAERKYSDSKKHGERKSPQQLSAGTITPFIQTKNTPESPLGDTLSSSVNNSLGNGSALDSTTQSFMESRFYTDFNSVKIHTGTAAAKMNTELNSKAFTVGNDIFFNAGNYAPGSQEGRHLIAHELTHTVQQKAMPVAVQKQDKNDKTFASKPEIDFKLLPPDLQVKLFHFLLEADTGKVHFDYQTKTFMAGLSYTYGDALSLNMRFHDFTTKLGWLPGDNTFSLGLSQGPFNAGLTAKPWQNKYGLNLTYGAPLLPLNDQMTNTFMAGGTSAGNLLTGLPGASSDPIAWYQQYKPDIENIAKTADLVKQITEAGKSKIKFGAGFSVSYDPVNELVITGRVGLMF